MAKSGPLSAIIRIAPDEGGRTVRASTIPTDAISKYWLIGCDRLTSKMITGPDNSPKAHLGFSSGSIAFVGESVFSGAFDGGSVVSVAEFPSGTLGWISAGGTLPRNRVLAAGIFSGEHES